MIALHPTGCKLSSFLLHLLSFALQKKTKKKPFSVRKYLDKKDFFEEKSSIFFF